LNPRNRENMTPRHLRLILNGKSANRPDIRGAVAALRKDGHRVSVRVTWEGGDAARFAAEAVTGSGHDPIDVVVAGGGDGTLNEVASGLLQAGRPADETPALGVLPLGTANDFATGLGLDPADVPGCLHIAATGGLSPLDVGMVNGRPFINMATGGFGATVTTQTDPALKRLVGGAAYLFTGLQRFSELSASEGHIEAEGFSWSGQFLALAVGNGRQAGGGAVLCPAARIEDGLLDLTIIPSPARDEIGPLLSSLFENGLRSLEQRAVTAQIRRMRLQTQAEIQMNLDGEPIRGQTMDVCVEEARLRIVRPSGHNGNAGLGETGKAG